MSIRVLTALSFVLSSNFAMAQVPQPDEAHGQVIASTDGPDTHLSGRLITLGHFRSDSDFDPTNRYFDRDGQTESQVATFFAPTLHIRPSDQVKLIYEAELGWNAWSRHDPGFPIPYFESQRPGLNLRHRQVMGQVTLKSGSRLQAGYQHFADPSRLFVDHVLGAVRFDVGNADTGLTVLVGQMPEDTYEGLLVGDDNMVQDNGLLVIQARNRFGDMRLDSGLYGVADGRQVGRPLHLGVGLLGVRGTFGVIAYHGHGLAQFGRWKNAGLNGDNVSIRAYALSAGVRRNAKRSRFRYGANAFAVSGDDTHHGNDTLGAFFTSAKNHSPTRYLTEDEDRDRYDNLDERLGSIWGPFFYNRAGLAIVDAFVGWAVMDVDMTLVLGHGMVLVPDNIMGHRHVGTEATLQSQLMLAPGARVFCALTGFLPQDAAAVRVNDVDRAAKDPVMAAQAGLHLSF